MEILTFLSLNEMKNKIGKNTKKVWKALFLWLNFGAKIK